MVYTLAPEILRILDLKQLHGLSKHKLARQAECKTFKKCQTEPNTHETTIHVYTYSTLSIIISLKLRENYTIKTQPKIFKMKKL